MVTCEAKCRGLYRGPSCVAAESPSHMYSYAGTSGFFTQLLSPAPFAFAIAANM